jgi:hypothetical protein
LQFQFNFSLINENDITGSAGTDIMERSDRIWNFSPMKYLIMFCHVENECSIFNKANDTLITNRCVLDTSEKLFFYVHLHTLYLHHGDISATGTANL